MKCMGCGKEIGFGSVIGKAVLCRRCTKTSRKAFMKSYEEIESIVDTPRETLALRVGCLSLIFLIILLAIAIANL